eukprot:GHVQ01031068.1.p1 GENE.GHVQ01031068.1~~GHVQ01031068.1.p1  ORF type:complete len:1228 (+),score=168.16 GHVQ01031068.1:359-4042(+)
MDSTKVCSEPWPPQSVSSCSTSSSAFAQTSAAANGSQSPPFDESASTRVCTALLSEWRIPSIRSYVSTLQQQGFSPSSVSSISQFNDNPLKLDKLNSIQSSSSQALSTPHDVLCLNSLVSKTSGPEWENTHGASRCCSETSPRPFIDVRSVALEGTETSYEQAWNRETALGDIQGFGTNADVCALLHCIDQTVERLLNQKGLAQAMCRAYNAFLTNSTPPYGVLPSPENSACFEPDPISAPLLDLTSSSPSEGFTDVALWSANSLADRIPFRQFDSRESEVRPGSNGTGQQAEGCYVIEDVEIVPRKRQKDGKGEVCHNISGSSSNSVLVGRTVGYSKFGRDMYVSCLAGMCAHESHVRNRHAMSGDRDDLRSLIVWGWVCCCDGDLECLIVRLVGSQVIKQLDAPTPASAVQGPVSATRGSHANKEADKGLHVRESVVFRNHKTDCGIMTSESVNGVKTDLERVLDNGVHGVYGALPLSCWDDSIGRYGSGRRTGYLPVGTRIRAVITAVGEGEIMKGCWGGIGKTGRSDIGVETTVRYRKVLQRLRKRKRSMTEDPEREKDDPSSAGGSWGSACSAKAFRRQLRIKGSKICVSLDEDEESVPDVDVDGEVEKTKMDDVSDESCLYEYEEETAEVEEHVSLYLRKAGAHVLLSVTGSSVAGSHGIEHLGIASAVRYESRGWSLSHRDFGSCSRCEQRRRSPASAETAGACGCRDTIGAMVGLDWRRRKWDGGSQLLKERSTFMLLTDPRFTNPASIDFKLGYFSLPAIVSARPLYLPCDLSAGPQQQSEPSADKRPHCLSFMFSVERYVLREYLLSAGTDSSCRLSEYFETLPAARHSLVRSIKDRLADMRPLLYSLSASPVAVPCLSCPTAVCTSLGVLLANEQSRQWAQLRVSEGLGMAELRDFELAVEYYDTALALCPKFPEALVARGAAYANLGKLEKAFKDLTTALDVDPDHKKSIKCVQLLVDRWRKRNQKEKPDGLQAPNASRSGVAKGVPSKRLRIPGIPDEFCHPEIDLLDYDEPVFAQEIVDVDVADESRKLGGSTGHRSSVDIRDRASSAVASPAAADKDKLCQGGSKSFHEGDTGLSTASLLALGGGFHSLVLACEAEGDTSSKDPSLERGDSRHRRRRDSDSKSGSERGHRRRYRNENRRSDHRKSKRRKTKGSKDKRQSHRKRRRGSSPTMSDSSANTATSSECSNCSSPTEHRHLRKKKGTKRKKEKRRRR